MLETATLNCVPTELIKITSSVLDGMNPQKPINAIEYREGHMSFIACAIPGLLNSSIRALYFKPVKNVEFLCHVRFSFRPCSGLPDELNFEFTYEVLRELLRGSGIRIIDTGSTNHIREFYHAIDGEIMNAFRRSGFTELSLSKVA